MSFFLRNPNLNCRFLSKNLISISNFLLNFSENSPQNQEEPKEKQSVNPQEEKIKERIKILKQFIRKNHKKTINFC